MDVIKEITNDSGYRKIEIYHRTDGTYGFEAYKYSDDVACWFPYGNFSYGIFESCKSTVNEAKERVKWL